MTQIITVKILMFYFFLAHSEVSGNQNDDQWMS